MRVVTFLITGGSPFSVSITGRPKLDHDGRRQIWKYTERENGEAEKLAEAFRVFGPTVQLLFEEETEEMLELRNQLMGPGPNEPSTLSHDPQNG